MACERCAGEASTAAYLLHKGGGSRRVNLCDPCRDVTALVHVLEAVNKSRASKRSKKGKAPEAEAPETPEDPEAPEAEETDGEASQSEAG